MEYYSTVLGVQYLVVREDWEGMLMGRISSGNNKNVLELDCVDGCINIWIY